MTPTGGTQRIMRRAARASVITVVAGMVLVSSAAPVLAAETSNSEFVIIREDDVFVEDLYAGAISVVVEGTLDGDLIAFAAEEIVIDGTVTGSVIAVSPSVTVNGVVGGSLRVAGNRLSITGEVGADVVATVVSADLSSSSDVVGDVLVWSWNTNVTGSIGGDLTGTQRNLDLGGSIGGDVDVTVARLDIVEELTVTGDLGYRSAANAEGLAQATVGGAIVDKTPLPPNLRVRALGLLGRFLVILILSVAAISAAYGWPRRTAGAITEVGHVPIRRWLVGASVLFSPLIAIVLTGLVLGLAPAAAAFPLLAVLVPVILALLGVAFALGLVAGAPAVGWLGGVLFKRLDMYGAILAGSILIGALWYLPYIGWLVPVVVLPLGLGAWLATWRGQSSGTEAISSVSS